MTHPGDSVMDAKMIADDMETRFWSIVDRNGLTGLPSDMWAALEMLVRDREARQRTERNRDMWKGQCERQADQLRALKGQP